jgi:hypothetical protein
MDISKITPIDQWIPDFADGSIEGILRMVTHGNVNTITRTGEQFSHTDLVFIILARKAFDVMVRCGWGVRCYQNNGKIMWEVTKSHNWDLENDTVICDEKPDPFTALVEADNYETKRTTQTN